MSEDESRRDKGREEFSTLSDDVGALIVSAILFVVGGLLVVSGWGKVIQLLGGVLALFGVITGRIMFWGILKSLWHSDR